MQAAELHAYLLNHSADAILVTDANLLITYANYAMTQLVSRTVLGDALSVHWWPEDLAIYEHIIESAQIGSSFSIARVSGFLHIVNQFTGIEVVGRIAADWDREKGRQAAQKLLRANPPGTLDAIWTASGEMALGALETIESEQRQHEIKLFSNDVTPESVHAIRDGKVQAETHHGFADWGWYGTQFAVMLALGQPVPQRFDIRPRTVYRANAGLYYPEPDLAPIDWSTIAGQQPLPPRITIGWIQAAPTGVYDTAAAYFEKAAKDARTFDINVHICTRVLDYPDDFNGAATIIDEFIAEQIDVIVLSTVKVAVVRNALRNAEAAGIPVIVVNQLEQIEETNVACYIGFDNAVAGQISGYALVDYLAGSRVLGGAPSVVITPATDLDLSWWQMQFQAFSPAAADVRGRVAIIEGISGSWQGEHRLVQANGESIFVDTTTFPVHSKSGEFLGLAAAFRDATKRKETEAALRSYSEELELLVSQRTQELHRVVQELQQEVSERRKAEVEKEQIIQMLEEALAHVKNLSGLLPICASCKKIRDDAGNWHQLEVYISDHAEVDFSHGICPECRANFYRLPPR